MSNIYPGYAYLTHNLWVRREHIPKSLLDPYDRAWAIAENNPGRIERTSGRAHAAIWLDCADEIRSRMNPLLDGAALRAALAADELRKAHQLDMRAKLRP